MCSVKLELQHRGQIEAATRRYNELDDENNKLCSLNYELDSKVLNSLRTYFIQIQQMDDIAVWNTLISKISNDRSAYRKHVEIKGKNLVKRMQPRHIFAVCQEYHRNMIELLINVLYLIVLKLIVSVVTSP